jgi:hypothetical protein
MTGNCAPRALIDAARAPYRRVGGWPYHHARGKLSGDPANAAILRFGLLGLSADGRIGPCCSRAATVLRDCIVARSPTGTAYVTKSIFIPRPYR